MRKRINHITKEEGKQFLEGKTSLQVARKLMADNFKFSKEQEEMVVKSWNEKRGELQKIILGDPSRDFAKYVEFHGAPSFWTKLNNCRQLGQGVSMYFEGQRFIAIICELRKTHDVGVAFVNSPFVCCQIPNDNNHFLMCTYLPEDGEYEIAKLRDDGGYMNRRFECIEYNANEVPAEPSIDDPDDRLGWPQTRVETRTCKTFNDIIETFEYFGFMEEVE